MTTVMEDLKEPFSLPVLDVEISFRHVKTLKVRKIFNFWKDWKGLTAQRISQKEVWMQSFILRDSRSNRHFQPRRHQGQ